MGFNSKENTSRSRAQPIFFPCQFPYHSNKDLNEFHNWVIWSETPMMYLCSHPSKSSATLPKFKSETCATPRRYISEPFKTRYSAPHPYSLHTPSSLFQSLSPIHRTLPIPTSMRRRTNPPFGSATTVDRAGRNLDFNEKTHGLDRSAPKPTWKFRRHGSLPRAFSASWLAKLRN